jgi:polysaccharide biosynthesis transport protein
VQASSIANEFASVYTNPNFSQIQPDSAYMQDFASVPVIPISPDKKLSIILFIIVIIAGELSIFFLRKFNDIKIKDSNDILTYFKSPILGSVPKIKPDGRYIKTKTDVDRVVEIDPLCIASEAYRSIKTKLLFSLNNSGSIAKNIIITSSTSKEGKTISAINLAIMIANSGESVLLVDMDVKKPRIHSVFNVNNDIGLMDYLSGKARFEDIIKYSGVNNLAIIASRNGSYGTIEYDPSKNIKTLLEKAGLRYSKVIFDVPYSNLLADPLGLLSVCDGVILVVEGSRTTKRFLRNSEALLYKAGANIIGVILNKVTF